MEHAGLRVYICVNNTYLVCIMKKISLSNAVLKNIAYLTMFVDHSALVFYTEMTKQHSLTGYGPVMSRQVYSVGRLIGRSAFILFAYLIAEGFIHTSSKLKYLLRLILFAFISEIPYNLVNAGQMFDYNSQNIYFTLAISVFVLIVWEWAGKSAQRMRRAKAQRDVRWYICVGACVFAQLGALFLGCYAAHYLRTDYQYMGVLLIFTFYILRDKPIYIKLVPVACVMFLGMWSINLLKYAHTYTFAYLFRFSMRELFGLFAFVPIALYDGTKGRQLPKAVCYGFYPVHLIVLRGIAHVIVG